MNDSESENEPELDDFDENIEEPDENNNVNNNLIDQVNGNIELLDGNNNNNNENQPPPQVCDWQISDINDRFVSNWLIDYERHGNHQGFLLTPLNLTPKTNSNYFSLMRHSKLWRTTQIFMPFNFFILLTTTYRNTLASGDGRTLVRTK